jgi:hypothetical protein
MRARSLIAVAVFIAVGASACGSSSKSPTAVGATGTTTTTSPTASGAPGGAPTTIKLSGSSGSNFCQLARSDQAAFSSPDLSNPANLKKEYQNLGKALQDAANAAPSAIKGDFETFITAFKPYLQALADANYDFTKVNTDSLKAISSTQVDTASQHIEQYFEQVCHISPPTT